MIRFSPRPNRAQLVNWREWGEAAFREAEEQDKPIALLITAFWCGFCQRMDETSLSEDEVITLLNAFFIPVRVEESQRPDVDLRYNQNGWPTVCFFTPLGVQLASLNYTAPEEFVGALVKLVDYYQKNRDALRQIEPETASEASGDEDVPLTSALVDEVAGIMEGLADREYGGYGLDLKLLHTQANEFALYLYETNGEQEQLDHVALTLTKLRQSRTFDTEEGGFFRYSSRRDWQEPHPEKLLADQATLLSNYLDAYLLTGDASHRETAEGLILYLNGTLTTDEAWPCFAGCQDYPHGSPKEAAGVAERPFILDNVIYCDANALAASAYLKAWWLLGNQDCRTRAVEILEYLWSKLRAADGGMHHYRQDEPQVPGLLNDALAMGGALLDAYSTLGDTRYVDRAHEMASYVVNKHSCPNGGFYDLSQPGPGKLSVPLTLMPENAAAGTFFTRLADLSGEPEQRGQAAWALKSIPNSHRQYGAFAASLGQALARLLAPPLLVDLTGAPGADDTLSLLRAALTRLRHDNVVLRFHQPDEGARPGARLTLTQAGTTSGPISDPEALRPDILAAQPSERGWS